MTPLALVEVVPDETEIQAQMAWCFGIPTVTVDSLNIRKSVDKQISRFFSGGVLAIEDFTFNFKCDL